MMYSPVLFFLGREGNRPLPPRIDAPACESGFVCVDGRSRYLYIVLGGYLCIFGVPIVQSYCTLSIYVSFRVFICGRYRKSRVVCVWLSSPAFMRSRANHPAGSHGRLAQKR